MLHFDTCFAESANAATMDSVVGRLSDWDAADSPLAPLSQGQVGILIDFFWDYGCLVDLLSCCLDSFSPCFIVQ